MGFKVDTAALTEFASFVKDFGDDADGVYDFIRAETDMSVHGAGFLDMLLGGHSAVVQTMCDRTFLLGETAAGSAFEVDASAFFYDERDTANAEELDGTYPGVSTSGAGPNDDSAKGSFSYKSAQDELDITKKPGDLEPKAGEVEKWCRTVLDQFSLTAGIREVLKAACGFDPIEWLRSWFTGEWKAWARCALAWEACGDTVKAMSGSLDPGLAKLPEVWEGNAADSALDYFSRLQDATVTEATAFDSLAARYKVYLELIYELHLVADDTLNTVCDIALDVLLLAPSFVLDTVNTLLGQESQVGQFLFRICDLMGKLSIAVTAVIDAIRLFETIKSAWELPGFPDSDIPELNNRHGSGMYEHSWEHPDKDVR